MVKFIEDKHLYVNDDGEYFTSVTKLIHQFEPVKDWDKIAKNYAKKHKKSVEEVRAAWKAENQKSVDRGTRFHKVKETELCEKGCVNVEGIDLNIESPTVVDGIKHSRSLKLDNGIYPELIIFLDSAKLAGQADYIEVVNGKINIKDYKTNKEIKMEGFRDWKGSEEKLTGPLSHLGNCNYTVYCLQLNTYMYMLKKHNPNLKIGTMELLHILFDENGEPKEEVIYQLPNMQKDVKNMIDYWVQKNN